MTEAFNDGFIKDFRVPEVRKIVSALVTSSLYQYTKLLLVEDTIIFTVSDTLLYSVKLKNTVPDNNQLVASGFACTFYDIANPINNDEELAKSDFNIMHELSEVYHKYNEIIWNSSVIAQDSSLRDNPEFESLLGLKADDGLKYYRMMANDHNPIFIPVFSGFPNLNKDDTIGIKVYCTDRQNYVVNATIYKKKLAREINMYYRILGL